MSCGVDGLNLILHLIHTAIPSPSNMTYRRRKNTLPTGNVETHKWILILMWAILLKPEDGWCTKATDSFFACAQESKKNKSWTSAMNQTRPVKSTVWWSLHVSTGSHGQSRQKDKKQTQIWTCNKCRSLLQYVAANWIFHMEIRKINKNKW